LVNYAGSERVVESLINIWNDADVFTLVDFLNDEQRKSILKGKKTNTTFIQHLPFARKKHRYYLPLFPYAIDSLNLAEYKLIISSNHAVSKGVKTHKNQLHICYCHSPMRYAWDHSDHYLTGVKGILAKAFMNYLRKWDLKSAENVDFFIANSNHIAEKIKRIYNRDSVVIYPPVDVDKFSVSEKKDDYYLIASRFVPYKKVDLVVEAFNQMPNKKLIVIGSGPDKEKIKNIAGRNIKFLPHQPTDKLKEYMMKAKAFVFAAEEDFGIVIVEAMACGTPVIALNKGGTAESVINGKTGILFNEQNRDSIITAIQEFEKRIDYFDVQFIRKHAENFDRTNFEENIKKFVSDKLNNFNP
ncbi:MAG TPA: glycosyltransferase, partial [Ignavibacteriaceae bacterium]